MEHLLENLQMCSCQYHQVSWTLVHVSQLSNDIYNLIVDILHIQPQEIHRVVCSYLATKSSHMNLDPRFVEFLISPVVPEDESRKKFIQKLWKLLLKQQRLYYTVTGGMYCYKHGLASGRESSLN